MTPLAALSAFQADASDEALASAADYLTGWGTVDRALSAINSGPAHRDDHAALVEFQAKGVLLRYSRALSVAQAQREAA